MARDKRLVAASSGKKAVKTVAGPRKVKLSSAQPLGSVADKKKAAAAKAALAAQAAAARAAKAAARAQKAAAAAESSKQQGPLTRKHRAGYRAIKIMRRYHSAGKTLLKTEPTRELLRAALRENATETCEALQDACAPLKTEILPEEVIFSNNALTVSRHFLDTVLHEVASKARVSAASRGRPTQFPSDVLMGMRMCGFPESVVRGVAQAAKQELATA